MSNEMIYKQAAIDALGEEPEVWSGNDEYAQGLNNQWHYDVNALKAVQSARLEQTDCIYCHEDSDGYVTPLEKNCHAYIRFGMNGWGIELKAKGWSGEAPINFCPMCGRRLEHG